MAIPNLRRRGGLFWWRRKVVVCGVTIPVALGLRTGDFHKARAIAEQLAVAIETLRMAYGERGSAVDAATLKKVFNDAMRWQLGRILSDQIGSGAPVEHHALANTAYAELWRLFARGGPAALWTADDDERVGAAGWPDEARLLIADLWEKFRHVSTVPQHQIDSYAERFGFLRTSSNVSRVQRVIYGARAEACDEATRRLGEDGGDYSGWVEDALLDRSPFAFDDIVADREPSPTIHSQASPSQSSSEGPREAGSHRAASTAASTHGRKKLLKDASEECIAEHVNQKAWSPDTVEQVRTAIRLFDYACGSDVSIEDLAQCHVKAFTEFCKTMPNRWGKTRAEIDGGLAASVRYGIQIAEKDGDNSRLGFSQTTLNKHITWITAVIEYAAGDGSGTGHQPSAPLSFKKARSDVGSKAAAKRTRQRDKRANWNREEIAKLLSAPIWTGSADLDHRFEPGKLIVHDAWYWLPLMYVLYGGRSSELAGLPMTHVHENDPIPFFQVDYTDLRPLKNVQSIRRLPIHPELVRLGFIEYVQKMRSVGHAFLFPEVYSTSSRSFASTVYKSVFEKWRKWAFPSGTGWAHQERGAWRDKDVHSFRGVATSLMKGKVPDSVRRDIWGQEGENTGEKVYDEEAELAVKLKALRLLLVLTKHIVAHPVRLRPPDRQMFGARRGRPRSK